MTARMLAIQNWIERGRTICPFGTMSHRAEKSRYVQLLHKGQERLVWLALRAFIQQEEQVLVFLLPPPDPLTWEAAGRAVHVVFEEIAIAMARINHPDMAVRRVRQEMLLRLAQVRLGQGVQLHQLAGGVPNMERGMLFTIGLGPQYSSNHVRLAPHTMVACTWQGDVEKARADHPAVLRQIQAEMKRRTGGLYDVDTLWLPEEVEFTPTMEAQ